jgi:hypothetical protein
VSGSMTPVKSTERCWVQPCPPLLPLHLLPGPVQVHQRRPGSGPDQHRGLDRAGSALDQLGGYARFTVWAGEPGDRKSDGVALRRRAALSPPRPPGHSPWPTGRAPRSGLRGGLFLGEQSGPPSGCWIPAAKSTHPSPSRADRGAAAPAFAELGRARCRARLPSGPCSGAPSICSPPRRPSASLCPGESCGGRMSTAVGMGTGVVRDVDLWHHGQEPAARTAGTSRRLTGRSPRDARYTGGRR